MYMPAREASEVVGVVVLLGVLLSAALHFVPALWRRARHLANTLFFCFFVSSQARSSPVSSTATKYSRWLWEDRTVLVTGAAQGIGREVAFALLARGATRLVLWDMHSATLARTEQDLRLAYPEASLLAAVVDVAEESAVERASTLALRRFGSVDVLVNNAGVVFCQPLLALQNHFIDRTLRVNALSPFLVTRAFLPSMLQLPPSSAVSGSFEEEEEEEEVLVPGSKDSRSQKATKRHSSRTPQQVLPLSTTDQQSGSGNTKRRQRRAPPHIVTVSSVCGLAPLYRLSDYCASKYASFGFAECVRHELQALGADVRSTVVCPYLVETGMFEGSRLPWYVRLLGISPLHPAYVAKRIIQAIEYGEEMVILPNLFRLVWLVRVLVPTTWIDLAIRMLGEHDAFASFRGRGIAFNFSSRTLTSTSNE